MYFTWNLFCICLYENAEYLGAGLHYLNNNLIPNISGTFSADVLENQTVSWKDLPVALVLNGLCFGFFLLADVFKKKEVQEEE